MAKSHGKNKGRNDYPGGFAGIPRIVMDHPDYLGLSGNAAKLLMELARQYKGKNNGNLTAAYSVVRPRGCGGAKDTLKKVIKELINAGMIIQTRDGWFMNPGARCSLYALKWKNIDECPGKDLDIGPTTTPLRKFSLEKINKTPGPKTRRGSSQKMGRAPPRNAHGQFESSQKLGRLKVVP